MRTDYSMWGGKPRQSLQILEMIAKHGDSDECLEWPYTRKSGRYGGYGYVQHEKKRWKVHRLTWKLVHGKLARATHVLHSCDNPPCFNPRHLFLGTTQDNIADKVRKGRQGSHQGPKPWNRGPNPSLQGEHCGKSKLTDDQVRTIRERYASGETLKEIAKDVGVNFSNVGHIVKRRTWKHVT